VVRRLPLLGTIAIAAGFVVIGVSWWAAHGRTYVDQQFPALVAGGIAGLGLVVLGGIALGVAAHHQATDRLAGHLRDLVQAAEASHNEAPAAVVNPEPAAAEHEPATQGPRFPTRNGNGNGHSHSNGAPSPVVVPRRTLFHDPTCRLVTTRDDTEVIARPDAVAAGLAACRVCRP
jgi:hypothetical protein